MKRLVALMMCAVSLRAAAQSTITYPYNPDGNADALIGVTDLQDMLSTYGGAFTPSEIQIDGVGLLQIIQDLQNQLNAIQTLDVNALESTLTALQEEVDGLEAENAALAQQVQALQNAGFLTEETDPIASASGFATETWVEDQGYSTGSGIEGLDNYLSVDEENHTVLISGANLQVVSGEGATDAAVNGTGNVIIGYDEDNLWGDAIKSGSHNLVVGLGHTYSSCGGVVFGYNNSITQQYASVSGGYDNIASGNYSSISGGYTNTASGDYSSISGGYSVTASGNYSIVSGGVGSTASGNYSSVFGGQNCIASGPSSSVSQGYYNTASGDRSIVCGGEFNQALGAFSFVSGGSSNTASGNYSTVLGGFENNASAEHSSVSGGQGNTASGNYSSVSGGAG